MKVEINPTTLPIPLAILGVDQDIGFHAAVCGSTYLDNPVLETRGMQGNRANVGVYDGLALGERGTCKQENKRH
jgi:hypothetical protein